MGNKEKRGSIKFSIPNLSEEADYVNNELLKKYPLYKKYGYAPKIPKENLKEEFRKNRRVYLKGLKEIKKFKKIWKKVYDALIIVKKDYNFKIFKNYEVRLTLYGTGGDYFPSYGAFDKKLRNQPGRTKKLNKAIILVRADLRKFFEKIIIHEIIHLGIEYTIVRKNKLGHSKKEDLVEGIYKRYFKEI